MEVPHGPIPPDMERVWTVDPDDAVRRLEIRAGQMYDPVSYLDALEDRGGVSREEVEALKRKFRGETEPDMYA